MQNLNPTLVHLSWHSVKALSEIFITHFLSFSSLKATARSLSLPIKKSIKLGLVSGLH